MRAKLLGLLVIAGLPLLACSSDEDEDGHTQTGVPAECKAIIDACHEKDAPGAAQDVVDCHEIGHAEKQAACASEQARCVSVCENAPVPDGGGHGGHAGSAGHAGAGGADAG